MKFAIVTPTIGTDYLQQCIESVQNQTYENLTHYIFTDGAEYQQEITKIISSSSIGERTIKVNSLEENIGKGWYGHRVYAACSFLVNADVICYLDEDNWLEPDHIETLAKMFKSMPIEWAYSLRKIHDKEGNFLCEDNCESLGKWPVYFNPSVFHIDTSCYAVKTDVAVRIGHAWFGQWGADRQFFNAIKQHFPKFACSGKHTVCYRLDGNPNSVTKEFFDQGNQANSEKYKNNYPWRISV